jgi:hypothetical protein
MIARVFALTHDNCTHHFVSTLNQLDGGLGRNLTLSVAAEVKRTLALATINI